MSGPVAPGPDVARRVERALGCGVASWRRVERGYTAAGRWVASLAGGGSCFVKHATDAEVAGWLREERAVYDACPGAPFLPRRLAFDDDGTAPILVLEDLSAAHWPPPWDGAAVAAVRDLLAALAATPAPAGLPSLETDRDGLTAWRHVAADPAPFLSLGLASRAWLGAALPTLVAAEAAAVLDGPSLVHGDVRSDNLCVTGGRALLVDWNWARRGNPRADLAFWMPSLAAEGGARPEDVCPREPELAALAAGFFAWNAGLPPGGRPARVRELQRFQLRGALPWAARALGLPAPDGRG